VPVGAWPVATGLMGNGAASVFGDTSVRHGMLVGSPGMQVPETTPDTYNLVLFGPAVQRTFTSYDGARLL
jgi:hypothetical protein